MPDDTVTMDLESLLACMVDDAAKLREENPEDEIADTLELAAQLLEAAAKQAARYQWMRNSDWDCFDSRWLCAHDAYGASPDELDALIDAKMAEEPAVG